ncbi:grasp-with-spasm system SPASM domain peptide maturase [Flavobacterium psychroterrae]|uniref:Grasp-with-spasm system SPASM domain peptide maturase n=1 Tax=Flavobacterium psychroterrae TaxID=2133767 RepID=A0ABS5PJM1_9FLAO|nr:grasp-with-spasm system SPASM domain peptide maturase [Flavobacterium psychroterrae]MBS7234125.1 grasp-with-spasm system SPASM domain peptide maturase [Flavobacterium psychroterrae]
MRNELYFILSSSCKIVRGYKRSVIIDYSRGNLYFISHEYHELVDIIDRNQIKKIVESLEDEESIICFEEFLSFIIENELAFLVKNADRYPKISEEVDENFVLLQDVIIEVDENLFNKNNFIALCEDLTSLHCQDFQIRLLSDFSNKFFNEIMLLISGTNCNYLEIHCSYNEETTRELLHKFIEEHSLISRMVIYGAPIISKYEVINEVEGHYPISLGEMIYLDYPFDSGNCCGIINHENLNFTSFHLHNKLKTKNGCLDKKITIDKNGNIKNCPSMKNMYGNIEETSIKSVVNNNVFTKFWDINKDQISVCKICEFRYNCTDCRAFIEDSNDLYSKPSKCSYNPVTTLWEDNAIIK